MPIQSQNNAKSSVTLKMLADRCGVSKWTVSLVLRGKPGISEATASKVRAMAEEMGYQPEMNEGARRLALRKQGKTAISHVVALFFPPTIPMPIYFTLQFQGVMEGLMAQKFSLLTLHSPPFSAEQIDDSLWYIFSRGDIDGVLLSETEDAHLIIPQRLRQNRGFGNRPIISLLDPFNSDNAVVADERQGAYLATRHLLELGHRHILQFIRPLYPTPHYKLNQRIPGIKQAFEEWKLETDKHLHTYEVTVLPSWCNPAFAPRYINSLKNHTELDAQEQQFISYLKSHPEITAIMAINDSNALFAWRALLRAGMRVPDDISIIGFDDTDGMINEFGENLLTSIHVPLAEIGREAANLIVRQITGEEDTREVTILPVELMVRESTAQLTSDDNA